LQLKESIGKDYTLQEVLSIQRNVNSKVYDNDIIIQKLPNQQKEIFDMLNIIVPKNENLGFFSFQYYKGRLFF